MQDHPNPAGAAPGPAMLPRIGRHVGDLLRLAWPVMLSRAGILLMAFCDMAMLGRYAPGAVGVANLGMVVFIPVLVIVIGFCTGLVPVVSQAYGAGHWRECGRAWRRGLIWGFVLALIGMWISWHSETILYLAGQRPDLAEEAGAVARALAPGLVAQVLFAVSAFYLESTRRPHFALWAMLGANVANAGLNWLLIFGNLGFPELGPVGAAIATTLARVGAAAAMLTFVFYQPRAEFSGVRDPWETFWGPGGWRAGTMMRKLGISAGLGNGFETVGFAAITLMAGTLGTLALDAYSISHNVVSTFFMVGLGLAVATGVRVGIAVGQGHHREAAFAGWVGLGTALALLGVIGIGVVLFRDGIAAIYTDDPAIAARAAALLMISAFTFAPDTAQVVMGQSVRALGDAWVAIYHYAISFVVVMVPLGWVAISVLGSDERGLSGAIIFSCVLATVLLASRFRHLTRRPAQRLPARNIRPQRGRPWPMSMSGTNGGYARGSILPIGC